MPIEGLDGEVIDAARVSVEVDRSGSPPWAFRVIARGRVALAGIASPARGHLRAWLEVRLPDEPPLDLEALFSRLGARLPPGSYVMVDLGGDTMARRELALGVPPAGTLAGWLLWRAGARWFKVWDFPEGGREGEEKLQGNLPSDEVGAARATKITVQALRRFLDDPLARRFPEAAQRARRVLLEAPATGVA